MDVGHHLADAHPAADLALFDIGVQLLLDVERVLDVLERELRRGLVGGDDIDRTYAEDALPERALDADVADAASSMRFFQSLPSGWLHRTAQMVSLSTS